MFHRGLSRFVDPEKFPLLVILDEESPKDKRWGQQLVHSDSNIYVAYEPFAGDVLNVRPFGPPKSVGYTRQLYSTFFFDLHTDADVIGVVDTDTEFSTFLTYDTIFDSLGRILQAELHGDEFYPGDALCLGEHVNKSTMNTEVMPIWFFRETFSNLRRHLLTSVNPGLTFDEAWAKICNNTPLSPVNVLHHFCSVKENATYKMVSNLDPYGMIVAAMNRWYVCKSCNFWQIACCRLWGENISAQGHCPTSWRTDIGHVLSFDNVGVHSKNPNNSHLTWSGNAALVKKHYSNAAQLLAEMPPLQKDRMKHNCAF